MSYSSGMKALLALCMVLACGGSTVGGLDGGGDSGTDAAKDGTSSESGSGPCGGDTCTTGLVCCGDTCVNTNNDPHNCGACGLACTGGTSMCSGSTCAAPTCQPTCSSGQRCCEIDGPGPSGAPQCVDGDTCPVGCPLCN